MRFFLPAVDRSIPVYDDKPLDSLAAGRSCYRDECGGHIGAKVHLPRSHPKISESAVKGCYLEGTVNWNFSKRNEEIFLPVRDSDAAAGVPFGLPSLGI